MCKQTIFHGYRGTEKKYSTTDKRKLKVSSGEDEYFGHGIYFFENDQLEAYNWVHKSIKVPQDEVSVLYALIETTKVFDLFDCVTYNKYIKIVGIIYSRLKKENKLPKIIKPFDCRVINDICEKEDYKLVKGGYSPNHKKGNQLSFSENVTRFNKIHIQLCVRDCEIIKELRII